MYEIRKSLGTVVKTSATVWQHAVVKDERTIAFTDSESDAQAVIDARTREEECHCDMCEA